MSQTLNDLMEFGHVVYSDGAGNVTDELPGGVRPMANEVVYQQLDADGQCIDDEIHDLYSGWRCLSGFTGQYSYNGPVMHDSEFIGGGLERYIREHEGYYVALIVDGIGPADDSDSEPIGWAIAYSDNTIESE